MQIGWAGEFFVSEKYFEGNKILIALAVLLGFNALYLAANWWAKTGAPDSEESLILDGRVRARNGSPVQRLAWSPWRSRSPRGFWISRRSRNARG